MGRIDDFIGQGESQQNDAQYEINDFKDRVSVFRTIQHVNARPGFDTDTDKPTYSHTIFATVQIADTATELPTYGGLTLDTDVQEGDFWYVLNRKYGMLQLKVTSVVYNEHVYEVGLK